jgi:prolyl oligopeptidase
MTRKNISLVLLLSFLFTLTIAAAASEGASGGLAVTAPPKTVVKEVKETVQGVEIVDPYRWLEDQNSPETRAWIDAQNEYSDGFLSKVPGREAIEQQLTPMIKIAFMGLPRVRNNRYFFFKRTADQDQYSLFVRKGLEGKDELLIDPLPLSPKHTTTVGVASVSQDGSMIAYQIREGGADEVTPHLLEVDTHKELSDVFPKGRYSGFSILNDKSGVYYTRVTPEGPRVYFHKIGTDASSDSEIFGKAYGQEYYIDSDMSNDGHYLNIEVNHGSAADKSEIYVKDLTKQGPITTVVKDIPAAFYGDIAGDKMFLRTNWKAPNWRLIEVDLKNPAQEKWKEIVPESKAVLDGFTLIGGKIAIRSTADVISHIMLLEPTGKLIRQLPVPDLGTISDLFGEWNSNEAFFSFTSFHIPTTFYRYDIATGKQTVWAELKIPIDKNKYEVKQVWYPSKDGTKIPMFLAHAKNIKLDGNNPVLLTGYGGFDVTLSPTFSAMAAVWMANGGVYAQPSLRGGGEFGEAWHHAGMLDKKQNVFDDFIAAGEWLIKNKYTSPAKLAIRGGSNGGLLVGAAVTQRPDLFGAVICSYPLLDMIRYQNFLVARYWVPEYGSSENAEQFKYIYAYSPYQHVKAGTKYPSVLFISGDSDTRVAPLHARKMTALMQASTAASDKPILLHYDTSAGHSGGTPAGKQIQNTTDELSFLFSQLDMSGQAKMEAANK